MLFRYMYELSIEKWVHFGENRSLQKREEQIVISKSKTRKRTQMTGPLITETHMSTMFVSDMRIDEC
jgi:hypothetical protein